MVALLAPLMLFARLGVDTVDTASSRHNCAVSISVGVYLDLVRVSRLAPGSPHFTIYGLMGECELFLWTLPEHF